MENMINIRDLSIRCGNCNSYQTLISFRQYSDADLEAAYEGLGD